MARSMLLIVSGLMAFALSSPHGQAQSKYEASTPPELKDRFGDPLPPGAIARIGTTRYRLPTDASGWALSPDGDLLAISNQDGIEIWELPAWKRKQMIKALTINLAKPPQFDALTFSADAKILAAHDANVCELHLLEVGTGKSVKKFHLKAKAPIQLPYIKLVGQPSVLVCAFIPQDDGGQTVQTWNVSNDKLTQSLFIPSISQQTCVVSGDGRWFATGSVQKPRLNGGVGLAFYLEIWNLATGKLSHKVGTELPLFLMAFSPDGNWLAACHESFLRIYDAANGKEKYHIRLNNRRLEHIQYSPDSRSLYVSDNKGKLEKWNTVTGEPVAKHSIPAPLETEVVQMAFRPDGKIFGLGLSSNGIHFWESTSAKLFSPAGVPQAGISELAFPSRGDLFVASDSVLAFWNPRTGDKVHDIPRLPIRSDEMPGFSIDLGFTRRTRNTLNHVLSESGDVLAIERRFYDVRTGKLLYVNETSRNSESLYTFFERGAKVASVWMKKVRIWNARTGRDISSFDLPLDSEEAALALSASSDGKHFAAVASLETATSRQHRILVWDAEKQSLLRDFSVQQGTLSTLFSPDGKWLVITESNRIRLVRVATKGEQEFVLPRTSEISQIAISPYGRQVAVANGITNSLGSESRRITIYEFASKKIRLELVGHPRNASVTRLAFSRDDGLLASGSEDTTVLVWKAGLRGFVGKNEVATTEATSDELAEWYRQIAGGDAKAAFQKMILLAQRPGQAVKLLADKIAPAQKPDTGGKTVREWIENLGNSQFAVRSKAAAMLQKLGTSTEPELRAVLATVKDVEVRRRIEELLDRLADCSLTADEILYTRAVELLEAIDTPDARGLLARWATGEATSVLTTEARIALARLRK